MRKKSYRKAIISTMLATSMVVGTVEEAGVLFSQKVIAATDEEDFETAGDSISPTKEVTDSAEYDIEPTAHATDPAEYDIEPTAKATDPAEKNRDSEKDVVDNPIVDDEDDMDSEWDDEDFDEDDYEYTTTEDGFQITTKGELIGYKGTAKEVVIPDTVKSIGSGAFYESDVEKITIPDSVTEIYSYVFRNCEKLKEVTIGKGVKVIPDGLFYERKSLERVTLSEGTVEIGDHAFWGAESLKSINFPKGLTRIGDYAFLGTKALKSIDLPEGLTTIGYNAFSESGITSLTVPGSVTNFDKYSFEDCNSLNTVVIEDGVSTIPESAFYGCEQLSKVTFPSSGLEKIGDDAFRHTNLTEVNIPSCGYLGWGALGNKLKKVHFGSEVKTLGALLFLGCDDLESVELSYGLEAIEGSAFFGCSITSIDIPNSVAVIGDEAFFGCSNLEHVTLPSNLKYFGSRVFTSTKWLNNLTEKMNTEGKLYGVVQNVLIGNILKGDSGVTADGELTLPNEQSGNMIAIGDLEMKDVKKLNIKEGVISVGGLSLDGGEEVNLADTVTSIGFAFLAGNDSIKKVKLSKMLAEISDCAFCECTALEKVEMPEKLSAIQYCAFQDCTSLKQITIPDTVTTIGEDAFSGCKSLSELTIPAGVNFIGEKAFDTGNDDFVLKVYKGSYAQQYAEENGITYEVIGNVDVMEDTKTVKTSGIVKKKENETPLAEGQYRITLNPMEGQCEKESIVVKNEESYKNFPSVSKAGGVFSGWYTEPVGGVKVENTTIVNLRSDMTLYAHFVENALKVKFDACGGELGQNDSERSCHVGDVYGELPVPTKSGSAFVGWYTQPTGGQIVTEDMVVELSGELSLYAHWISTKQNIDFDSLHFDFVNSRAAYGYDNPYRIPLVVFRYLYGKNAKAQAMYDEWPNWGGSCFGMVASAMMLNMSGDSMELQDFGSSYSKNSDVKTDSVNKVNQLSLTRFIETLHIAQRENGVAQDKDSHINDFAGIKAALEAAQSKKGLPIILSLHSATSGHAVVAYKMDNNYIYIYDPNYADKERTIAIKKDSMGNIVNWSYTINDVEPCGTSVEGSWISYYTMESVIKAWEKRNSQYYSSEIMVGTNSKDFKVYTSAGTEVATVVNGELTTPYSDVYLCDSDEDKGTDDKTKIYLPVGMYVLENTGNKGTFEVSVLGTERSISASTQAKKLTVDLVDRKSESECSIAPASGANYSITMESSALGDKKKVSVSGTGAGNEVQVEQNQGKLAFENCNGSVQVDNKNVSLVQVNASANAGGNISRQGVKSVVKGEDAVYAITPQSGYMVSDVKVDGKSVGNVAAYTFKNINQQHTINASFEKVSFANLSAVTLEEVKKGVLPKVQMKLGKQILTEKDDYVYQVSSETDKEIKIRVIGKNLYAGQSTEITFAIGTDAGTEKKNDVKEKEEEKKKKEEEKKKQATSKLQGKVETVEGLKYKITNASKKTVTVTKRVSSKKKVVIPAVIIIDDKTYKVTAIANGVWKKDKKLQSVTIGKNVTKIGSKAFSGAAKLKTITIKSKKISSVGAGAFSGIAQNAVVKAPSAKKRAYSKLFTKKGLPKSASVK